MRTRTVDVSSISRTFFDAPPICCDVTITVQFPADPELEIPSEWARYHRLSIVHVPSSIPLIARILACLFVSLYLCIWLCVAWISTSHMLCTFQRSPTMPTNHEDVYLFAIPLLRLVKPRNSRSLSRRRHAQVARTSLWAAYILGAFLEFGNLEDLRLRRRRLVSFPIPCCS